MAAALTPIKWPKNNYRLASSYQTLGAGGKKAVHDALNGIDPTSIPGQVLLGNAPYENEKRILQMQDSILRGKNTDLKGQDHMAFKLLYGTKSTKEIGDWHLYHDGGCTYVGPVNGVLQIKYDYNGVAPAGAAAGAAPVSPPAAPFNNPTDFPPLGAASSNTHQKGHNAQPKAPNQYKL